MVEHLFLACQVTSTRTVTTTPLTCSMSATCRHSASSCKLASSKSAWTNHKKPRMKEPRRSKFVTEKTACSAEEAWRRGSIMQASQTKPLNSWIDQRQSHRAADPRILRRVERHRQQATQEHLRLGAWHDLGLHRRSSVPVGAHEALRRHATRNSRVLHQMMATEGQDINKHLDRMHAHPMKHNKGRPGTQSSNAQWNRDRHPLVYSSTPLPQWSSGYDFRLSLTPTSRGRPGFDSLLRSISGSDSSSISPSSGAGSPASSVFFAFWS